jgi:large repetitive protein
MIANAKQSMSLGGFLRAISALRSIKSLNSHKTFSSERVLRSFAISVLSVLSTTMLVGFGMSSAVAQDFSVSNTAISPAQIPLGGTGAVAVDVTRNTGAGSTSLVVSLPSQLTAGTPLPSGCSATVGNTVTCTITPATNLNSETITIPVVAASIGGFSVSSTVTDGVGGSAANNLTSGSGSVIAGGDLQVSKVPHLTSNPAPASYPVNQTFIAGSLLSYTIRPSIASGTALPVGQTITVTDNLPAASEFQFNSVTQNGWMCNVSGTIIACTLSGPQAVGALPNIVVNGKLVKNTTGNFDNVVSIAPSTSGYGDPNTTNNGPIAVKILVGPGADLTPSISIQSPLPGGLVATGNTTKSIRLTATNNGPFDVTGGRISTTVPLGFTIQSLPAGCTTPGAVGSVLAAPAVVTCVTGTISGASGTQQFNIPITMPATPQSVTLNAQTTIPGSATPAGIVDTDPTNDTASTNFNVVNPASDLSVSKTNDNTGPVGPGGGYNSTFAVNNLGPSNRPYGPGATNPLVIVDTVDPNVVSIISSTPGFNCTGPVANKVTCTSTGSGTLVAGSSISVTAALTFTMTNPAAPIVTSNTACVGTTALNTGSPPDNNTANDCSGGVIGPVFTPVATTVNTTKQVAKNTNPGFANPGWTAAQIGANRLLATENNFFWRIAATPTTGGVIPTLVLTDNINTLASSPFVTPVSIVSTTAGGSCSYSAPTVTCTFTNVPTGTEVGAVIRVSRAVSDGTFTNTVNTSSPDAVLAGTLSASAQIQIDPVTDLEVTTKSVSPNPIRAGQQGLFTISTRNNGPSQAATVVMTDTIDPAKYEIISATFGAGNTPCSITVGTGLVSCAIGTMNLGDVTTTSITVRPITPFPGAPTYPIMESNTAAATTTTCEKVPPSPAGNADTVTTCNLAAALTNNSKTANFTINAQSFDLQAQKQNVQSSPPLAAALAGFGDPIKFRFRAQNLPSSASRAERVKLLDVLNPPDNTYTYTGVTVANVNAASASGGLTNDTAKTNSTVTCTLRAGTATDTCGVNALGKQVLECTLGPTAPNNAFLDVAKAVNFEVSLAYTTSGAFPAVPTSHSDTLNICGDTSLGGAESDPSNNVASTSVTVLPKVDLAVGKTTVTALPVGINQPVQYDIVVRNLGPSATQQVRVQDVLPPNFELITTGPNAPAVVLGTFVTATPSTATGATVSCTPAPAAITSAGQNQTVSCIVNAAPGPLGIGAFPGSTNAANTITVRIWAKAKDTFFTGPYLTNQNNTATVSVGQDGSGNPLAFDTSSANDTATSATQVQKASLAGRVFNDTSADGSFNGAEVGIGGVTVTLSGTDSFGNTVTRTATTITTAGPTLGTYQFDNLPPGTYTVTETQSTTGGLQNGPVNPPAPTGAATAGTYARGGLSGDTTYTGVVLAAGNTAVNYNFPEVQGATVSGYIYSDVNNDGVRAMSGEPGIAGIQVCLTGNQLVGGALPVPTCQTTDMNGFYAFSGLQPSDLAGYTITQQTQPAGFFDGKEKPGIGAVVPNSENPARAAGTGAGGIATGTTNATFDVISGVVVNAGENKTENNFGEIRPSTISGTVYLDSSNNQLLDGTETGRQAGVTITLSGTDINGNTVTATATTDMMGNYSFTGLLPGQYTVTQSNVTNFSNSGAGTQGAVSTNGVTPFQDRAGATLNTSLGTVSGTVVTPAINTITLAPNGNSTGNNFGLLPSSIAGRVCIDEGTGGGTANNGRCEAGETGVAGVTITLTGLALDGVTMVSRTATTDMTGNYILDNLPLPNATGYTITETQPSGLLDGRQSPGTLTPTAGAVVGTTNNTTGNDTITGIRFTTASVGTGYDFGELRPAQVTGFVYEDNNNNGQKEAGEAPIVGVFMKLTGTDIFGNPQSVVVQTDMNGLYTFNVAPSDATGYTVEEVDGPAGNPKQPNGYYDGKEAQGLIGAGAPTTIANSSNGSAGVTAPGTTNAATDRISGIVVGSNQVHQNNNFGEIKPAQISGAVFIDSDGMGGRSAGETGVVPNVRVTLTGTDINNNPVSVTTFTDGTGNYTFGNLLPGTYTVTEGNVLQSGQPIAYTHTGATPQGPNTFGSNFVDRTGATPTTTGIGTSSGGVTTPAISAIRLGAGGSSAGNNFGERGSSIAGRVCIDNGAGGGVVNDGRCQAGETGIPGVTVTISGTAIDGSMVSITFPGGTSGTGAYNFADLKLPNAAGYTITETQPMAFADGRQAAGTLTPFVGIDPSAVVGATNNTVGTDTITGIRFTTATNGVNYDFGEFRASSISGFVYADANVNNTRDPLTDPALPGVTVTLSGTDIDGNTITPISVMTDMNGQYIFPNLRPGNYRVVETQPAFASQGANNVGTGIAGTVTNTPLDTFNITLAENENATNFNFGELTTSISGSVYEDVNGNGVRDAGEPGIAGVPIQLTGTDVNMMMVTRNVMTDSNGNYSFVGLLASNPAGYIVREVMQPAGYVDALESVGTIGGAPRGNSTVNDQFNAIVLGPADTAINYNFGEVRTGGINGGVYVDSNNDGVRNPNEPPIPGVVITLTGTAFNGASVSLTTMTDASGNYSFNGLLPGNYTVTETQPAGFGDGSATAGSTGGAASSNVISNIPITSGAISSGNNFGERLFGISGTVYEDKNNDGIQGADEPGILGVTITLTGRDASGNAVNVVVTTDAQGKYVFPNLPPSDAAGYTITETQPTTFIEGRATPGSGTGTANPNGNVISGVVLGGAGPAGVVNYNFGELKPASVSGSVYDDRNNNGTRDATEPGIPGATITLTGTDDRGAMVSRTTTTDANGNYTFGNLRPGNYTVTETQPNNFTDGRETIGSLGGMNATNDRIDNIVVRSGDTGTNYNFGELSGGISGQVYVDLNNNGIPDPGEEPIAGVTITLTGTDSNGNPVTRTAVTDANGQYQIIGLPPSNAAGYTIVETQPPAYADGTARAGGAGGTVGASRISNIVFPGGSIVPGYDFGERGASIGGVVYVDTNDNGTRDANEVPIAGVTITLTGTDINGNAVSRTTVTGADGSYRFDGLALPGPNGYTITQTQPGGYLDGRESIGSLGGTIPGNDTFNVRFTTPGAVGTGYNFGERVQSPGSISGQVYLDSNGDRVNNDGSGSGQTNWIVELTFIGADGRPIVIATTRTDASGNYRFDNLPPGNYTVVFRNPSNGITSGRLQNITVGTGTTITRQDFPIDPSGVIFDNCTGRPIAGARVFIAGPAGFDPNIHLTDPQMQGQTVGADGFYQIFLTPNAPGGVYTLSVIPPPGYTTTGQTPPQATVLNATTCPIDPVPGTPCLVNPTARPVISGICPNPLVPVLTPLPGPTFYNQILIVPGPPTPQDVLNNHIGLTALPVGNQIVLRKSTARLNVVRGELVPYTVTATNTSMLTLNNVVVIDSMPPGFRYVPNSARISGPATAVGTPTTPITPTVNGNDLAFPIARFAPRDVYTITLLLSPGVGVGEGEYVNRALVRTDIRGGALSNLADATVKIVADPLFDCTDIIGKVYDDRNVNGYQDEGEPGLKGVRVVSARGITATTDSEGRYHIACAAIPQQDLGANFVLKVDERSLPSGYRTTTDNPLVERLTRGKVVKMNFGATIHRVVRLDISDAAFESGKSEFKPEFADRMKEVMAALSERPSVLRVGYLVTAKESDSLIDSRTKAIKQKVTDMWSRERKKPKTKDDRENIAQYPLDIEIGVVRDPSESQGTVNPSQAGGAK